MAIAILPLLKHLLIFAISVLLLVLIVGCLCLNRFMFHPPAPYQETFSSAFLRLGPNGSVAALYLPCPNAKATILYSHGNGEDLAEIRRRMEYYQSFGFAVLAYDYPGYGLSAGRPTEKGVYQNAEAAYAYLTDTLNIPASQILVMGYSIGTGPSCYLAEKHPDILGLVLHAPFLSAPRAITRIRILPLDPFPNIRRIPRIACPILVFHGTHDKLIPFSQGARIAAAAGTRSTLVTVEGATHYNILKTLGATDYAAALDTFVSRASRASHTPQP